MQMNTRTQLEEGTGTRAVQVKVPTLISINKSSDNDIVSDVAM